MKKYIQPELEVVDLNVDMDILTASPISIDTDPTDGIIEGYGTWIW